MKNRVKKINIINNSVFYFDKKNLFEILKLKDLEYIKDQNYNGKSRLCTHKSPKSKVHEMFIFHKKNFKVNSHKHSFDESFLLLSGKVKIMIYDKNDVVIKTINLKDINSGENFYYKISRNVLHSQFFQEDSIFFEVSQGPFLKNKNKFKKI